MHIPDGWLSWPILLFAWAVTIMALAIAVGKIKNQEADTLSSIGAVAAVIFVAQMFNFPIAGGTSGHMLGAAFATLILGAPGAIIVMFSVLAVQAFVFADGGILALGANAMNMGVIGVLVAGGVRKTFEKLTPAVQLKSKESLTLYLTMGFLSAFLSVFVASFVAGIELVLSGATTFSVSIPPILAYHFIIGIGEGILTVFILVFLHESEFPVVTLEENRSFLDAAKSSNKAVIGLSIVLLFLSFLSLFASSNPDGLEKVGIIAGLEEKAKEPFKLGIANDYQFLGLTGAMGTFFSALLGIIILLGIFLLPAMYWQERKMTRQKA